MMEYTKGEWELVQSGSGRLDVVSGNKTIARTSEGSTVKDCLEILANAHLIKASPMMYEALKNLVERIDHGWALGEKLDISPARQALTKAEGDK